MSSNTVAEFANELKMAPAALLEQLRGAGVQVNSVNDAITETNKTQLLESLRRAHGATEGKKITLTRKQTSEIRQSDATGRARTIQVEVRKKRVFVKRDIDAAAAEAAAAAQPDEAQAAALPVADETPVQDIPAVSPAIEAPEAVNAPEADLASAAPESPASQQDVSVADTAAATPAAEPAAVSQSESEPVAGSEPAQAAEGAASPEP